MKLASVLSVRGDYWDRSLYALGKGKLLRDENIKRDNDRYKVRIFWNELRDTFRSNHLEEMKSDFELLWSFTESPREFTENELAAKIVPPIPNEDLSKLFRDCVISNLERKQFNEKLCKKFPFEACDFIKYCRDNAAELSEPSWWMMIRILVNLGKSGKDLIHELSEPHPEYDFEKTEEKINHAKDYRCPSCAEIKQYFQCREQCEKTSPLKLLENYIDIKTKFNLLYEVREDGLYYHPDPFAGDDETIKLSSYIRVKSRIRTLKSNNWGTVIELRDPDEVHHQLVLNREDFAGKSDEIMRLLYREGLDLEIGQHNKFLLLEYLRCASPTDRSVRVEKGGWHGQIYLIGDTAIGGNNDVEYIPTQSSVENLFNVSGTLEEWKEYVAKPCDQNPLLQFLIATPFAGPLLTPCNYDSFGIHNYGQCSSGKTTAAMVSGSVCGGGGVNGFIGQWRTTSNGLEGLAKFHNDCALFLDEVSQIDPKDLYESTYMLINNEGKNRAKRDGEAQKKSTWKVVVFSTGEKTIGDKIEEDKRQTMMAGQAVRFIDVEANAGMGLGVFSKLPKNMEAAQFSQYLKENSKKYYGTAIRKFVEIFIQNYEENIEKVKRLVKTFEKELQSQNDSNQVLRVITSLSIVAASGELAMEFGILPWTKGSMLEIVRNILKKWVDQRNGNLDFEMNKFEQRVRTFFRKYENKRFKYANNESEDAHFRNLRVTDFAGYRWKNNGQEFFLVIGDVFRDEILLGFNRNLAIQKLIENNWILTRKKTGKLWDTIELTLDGAKFTQRGYIFIPTQWEHDSSNNNRETQIEEERDKITFPPYEISKTKIECSEGEIF